MIMKALEIGNTHVLVMGCTAIFSGFYFCILEEYYTGGLELGYINGVTDGSLLIIGMFMYMGYYGNGVFTDNYKVQLMGWEVEARGGELFLYWATLMMLLLVTSNIIGMLIHQWRKRHQKGTSEYSEAYFSVGILFRQVLAFYLLAFVVYLSAITMKSPIIKEAPLLPLLLHAFTFVHNTLQI
jgi:uncharacterized Tic20 family protein